MGRYPGGIAGIHAAGNRLSGFPSMQEMERIDAARGCPGSQLSCEPIDMGIPKHRVQRACGVSGGSQSGLRAIAAVGGNGAPTGRLVASAGSIAADLIPRVGQLGFANTIDVVLQ